MSAVNFPDSFCVNNNSIKAEIRVKLFLQNSYLMILRYIGSNFFFKVMADRSMICFLHGVTAP